MASALKWASEPGPRSSPRVHRGFRQTRPLSLMPPDFLRRCIRRIASVRGTDSLRSMARMILSSSSDQDNESFCPSFVREGGTKAGKTEQLERMLSLILLAFGWLGLYCVWAEIALRTRRPGVRISPGAPYFSNSFITLRALAFLLSKLSRAESAPQLK
jgi:hypothetical protein